MAGMPFIGSLVSSALSTAVNGGNFSPFAIATAFSTATFIPAVGEGIRI